MKLASKEPRQPSGGKLPGKFREGTAPRCHQRNRTRPAARTFKRGSDEPARSSEILDPLNRAVKRYGYPFRRKARQQKRQSARAVNLFGCVGRNCDCFVHQSTQRKIGHQKTAIDAHAHARIATKVEGPSSMLLTVEKGETECECIRSEREEDHRDP